MGGPVAHFGFGDQTECVEYRELGVAGRQSAAMAYFVDSDAMEDLREYRRRLCLRAPPATQGLIPFEE